MVWGCASKYCNGFGLHCCPILPPYPPLSIIKAKIESRFMRKDNSGPVIFCISLCYSGIPPNYGTSLFGSMSDFVRANLLHRDPLWNIVLAVDCETTFPIRSVHIRLTVLKDRNCFCCITRFTILSSQSIVFFRSPYLALLAQLPVCMNLSHTLETVFRLMYGNTVGRYSILPDADHHQSLICHQSLCHASS